MSGSEFVKLLDEALGSLVVARPDEIETAVKKAVKPEIVNEVKAVFRGNRKTPESWAKEAIEFCKCEGITDGSRLDGYVTREECAVMIYRALLYIKEALNVESEA